MHSWTLSEHFIHVKWNRGYCAHCSRRTLVHGSGAHPPSHPQLPRTSPLSQLRHGALKRARVAAARRITVQGIVEKAVENVKLPWFLKLEADKLQLGQCAPTRCVSCANSRVLSSAHASGCLAVLV